MNYKNPAIITAKSVCIPFLIIFCLINSSVLAMSMLRTEHQSTIIKGTVTDSFNSQPVLAAGVKIYKRQWIFFKTKIAETQTDSQGNYCVKKEVEGGIYVEVSKSGYKGAQKSVSVKYGETYPVDFSLIKINITPQTVSVTPASGTSSQGKPVNFSAVYADNNGYNDIKETYLLINTSSSSKTNCAYLFYNQSENKLYLRNDSDSQWSGGFAPGSPNAIENSAAVLNCAQTTVTGAQTNLTINWDITFKPEFLGVKNLYLYVKDGQNAYSGWKKQGTWTIINNPPGIGSLTLSSPTPVINQPVTISAQYSDSDGYDNLQNCQISISGIQARYNQNENKLYLKSTDDKTWIGGISPGQSQTLENSFLKLNCQSSQVSGAGDSLAVNWQFVFKEEFNGEKTIYLKAQDNSNAETDWQQKGSLEILLNKGIVIGPEGGEIVSEDKKVRIIIPQGALEAAVRIQLRTLTGQDLSCVMPENKTILRVVECRPYDLVFAKPVTLIYTLDNLELPGTVVELGLYKNNEMEIAGRSAVETDNRSVSFSLVHFSTYAAIKNLVSNGAPIGGGVQIPLPDMFTGSFSHTIPITVVPARLSMQPAVALTYRSSNPNSWTGLGFSFNPGYIVRSTRLGPASYDDTTDTFYFITDSGTTELVHLTGNLYQAKIESGFTKFFKEPYDSWRLLGKDGGILKFGETVNSREISGQGSYSWYLTKAIDTNGNYIEYSYSKDQGKCYLEEINYTGNENGTLPTNSVRFFTEDRADIPSSYLSGSRIATAKRLKEIEVTVNSELVWRYELGYDYSKDTNRSLLRYIKQYAADDKELPVQEMKYQ